jgi:hypothetical protein
MVGIGGGAWSHKVDVRLVDVIVSQPDGIGGGVVQVSSFSELFFQSVWGQIVPVRHNCPNKPHNSRSIVKLLRRSNS